MDSLLIEYIKQRMRELGFSDFSFEPIRVKDAATDLEINANNEYYFLTSKTVDAGLIIRSDTNIFNEAVDYANFQFYGVQEFTGQIMISQPVAIDLEFIRVIPRVPRNDKEHAVIDNMIFGVGAVEN